MTKYKFDDFDDYDMDMANVNGIVEITQSVQEPIKESKTEKEEPKSNSIAIEEYKKLKEQLEKEIKQKEDSKKWGQEQSRTLAIAKKKLQNLTKKLSEESILYDENHIREFEDIFNNISEDVAQEEVKSEDALVYEGLKNAIERKNEDLDDTEAEKNNTFFNCYFHHITTSISAKKLEDEKLFLSSESPKKILKYILDKGKEFHDDFYSDVAKKGDAHSVVKDLKSEITKLRNENKLLKDELDNTEGVVHTKTMKADGLPSNKTTKKVPYADYIADW